MSSSANLHPDSIYILLFYLRESAEGYKYHWGLLNTGSRAPSGHFFHATDLNRAPLDLYRQAYPTNSGSLRSSTVVCALYVGPSIGLRELDACTQDSATRLMRSSGLPRHEPQWTCRVWVETVLGNATRYGLQLPNMAQLELGALAAADNAFVQAGQGNAIRFNDRSWMGRRDRIPCRGRSGSPMDIDSTGSRRRDDGRSKPMQGVEYGSSRQSSSRSSSGHSHSSRSRR